MGLETIAAMGILSGLTSTAINVASQDSMNSKNFAQQKKLMQYQDELNASRWNEQFNTITDFNSPKNQLGSLQEAGINPLFDSDFSGQTSASIGTNTSLGSYAGTPPHVDLGSVARSLADAIFTNKSLQLDERRVKAMEKKTDVDIENQTAATLSEVKVNLQRIENMIKEGNKTEKDIEKIDTDIVATKESIRQNWDRIRLEGEKTAQGWADLGIKDFTSKWQKSLGEWNARISQMDAGTRAGQLNLAKQEFGFAKDKFVKEYDFEVKKWSSELRKDKIDSFIKILDNTNNQIFGSKFTSPSKVANATAMMTAFVNNMDKLSNDSFMKVAPNAASTMIKISSLKPFYPLPFGGKKMNWDDFAPKNASDGF